MSILLQPMESDHHAPISWKEHFRRLLADVTLIDHGLVSGKEVSSRAGRWYKDTNGLRHIMGDPCVHNVIMGTLHGTNDDVLRCPLSEHIRMRVIGIHILAHRLNQFRSANRMYQHKLQQYGFLPTRRQSTYIRLRICAADIIIQQPPNGRPLRFKLAKKQFRAVVHLIAPKPDGIVVWATSDFVNTTLTQFAGRFPVLPNCPRVLRRAKSLQVTLCEIMILCHRAFPFPQGCASAFWLEGTAGRPPRQQHRSLPPAVTHHTRTATVPYRYRLSSYTCNATVRARMLGIQERIEVQRPHRTARRSPCRQRPNGGRLAKSLHHHGGSSTRGAFGTDA